MTDPTEPVELKAPDSVSLRARRHRARRKNKELQLAIAISKLVQGTSLGDHRNVLQEYLTKFTRLADLDDDQMRLLDSAVDRLASSRNRF